MRIAAAGNAFCEAAQCQMKQQSNHESAGHYVDAATCFRKADPNGITDTESSISDLTKA